MVESRLEVAFPRLRGQFYRIQSPKDDRYNCIAFAAGDSSRWWWPDAVGDDFWPNGIARVESVDSFREAFATLGYVV